MDLSETRDAQAAASEFAGGAVCETVPFGSGHINETYLVTCGAAGSPTRFVLQRVNRAIFRDPVQVMRNIERVTAHIAAQVADEPDAERRVLTLIPARDGRRWHVDATGETWRAFRCIEGARTFDEVASAEHAFRAARAFGRFQGQLASLPEPALTETILDFHNTAKRFAALEQAIAKDAYGRVDEATAEIEFAMARRVMTSALVDARLPVRTVHNDTKLNNVLFDEASGEAICVIDLDTVMPGTALSDFGDMVRTMTCSAAEDERDLSRVAVRMDLFEAVARGYLAEAGGFLTKDERTLLVAAGKLIAFEQGNRFLADYFDGDSYYNVQRAGQNLDRARTQFKLVESIEEQEEAMQRLVEAIA